MATSLYPLADARAESIWGAGLASDWASLRPPAASPHRITKPKRARGRIGTGSNRSPIIVDMTEIDIASARWKRAAKHYTSTTGWGAAGQIEAQILRQMKPLVDSVITDAASMAPRGRSGDLAKKSAYVKKMKNKKKRTDLYGITIQVGGRKGSAVAKRVSPYSMFPFWQGGSQSGYNWSAPKEWLWRATERKAPAFADAARKGLEEAYVKMVNVQAGDKYI